MASRHRSTDPLPPHGRAAGASLPWRPRHRPAAARGLLGPLTAAVSVFCAVGLAGCSSHNAPTVATIVKHDNAICSEYAQRLIKIATPAFDPGRATAKDMPAAAKYLDQLVPLMRAQQHEITSAGRPSASIDLYTSVLDALDAVIHDEQSAQTAAHAGNLHAFQSAYRTDAAEATRLSAVAHQFGLTVCIGG